MRGEDRPVISVVSLTWNSRKFLDAFVNSVVEDGRLSGLELELMVIDNGSTDGTWERLRQYERRYSELRAFGLSRNLGTTVSRNLGLRRARGEYVLVLDSDTWLQPGTLKALLTHFERLSKLRRVGLVAPRLIYPDGGFQESARRFPTVQTKLLRLLGWDELRRREESIPSVLAQTAGPVDYAISAAWFLRRGLLEEIGYLDETIFYSPEDVEYCARVWRAGYEIWYCPQVSIVHDCQRLTSKRPLSSLGLSHTKGLIKYWWQYDGFFVRPKRGAWSDA